MQTSDDKMVAMIVVDNMDQLTPLINENNYALVMHNADVLQVHKAFNAVTNGKPFVCNEVSGKLLNHLAEEKDLRYHISLQDKLTSREKQIALLICDSQTTNEIADELNISPQTISTHRKNILKKLGLKNSAALVRYAINYLYAFFIWMIDIF